MIVGPEFAFSAVFFGGDVVWMLVSVDSKLKTHKKGGGLFGKRRVRIILQRI